MNVAGQRCKEVAPIINRSWADDVNGWLGVTGLRLNPHWTSRRLVHFDPVDSWLVECGARTPIVSAAADARGWIDRAEGGWLSGPSPSRTTQSPSCMMTHAVRRPVKGRALCERGGVSDYGYSKPQLRKTASYFPTKVRMDAGRRTVVDGNVLLS